MSISPTKTPILVIFALFLTLSACKSGSNTTSTAETEGSTETTSFASETAEEGSGSTDESASSSDDTSEEEVAADADDSDEEEESAVEESLTSVVYTLYNFDEEADEVEVIMTYTKSYENGLIDQVVSDSEVEDVEYDFEYNSDGTLAEISVQFVGETEPVAVYTYSYSETGELETVELDYSTDGLGADDADGTPETTYTSLFDSETGTWQLTSSDDNLFFTFRGEELRAEVLLTYEYEFELLNSVSIDENGDGTIDAIYTYNFDEDGYIESVNLDSMGIDIEFETNESGEIVEATIDDILVLTAEYTYSE